MIASSSLANLLYRLCYIFGFLSVFIFNFFYAKKYKIRPGKALLFSIVSYVLIFAWSYVLAWVANGFQWGHHNAIRVYIWFPLVLFFSSRIFHLDFNMCCDYVTPSTCIVYGIARVGCIFPGCCRGFPMEHGMMSYNAGYKCFPVQLCEAITSLLIAIIVIRISKKKNYDYSENTLYPTMLILYGGTRFIWEFFADNRKVFWNISELALWAFATCLMGIIWLVIHAKKSKRFSTGM